MVLKSYRVIEGIKKLMPEEEKRIFQYILDNIGDYHLTDGIMNTIKISVYCDIVGDKCYWMDELQKSLIMFDVPICLNENADIVDKSANTRCSFSLLNHLAINTETKEIEFYFHNNIIPHLLLYKYGKRWEKGREK